MASIYIPLVLPAGAVPAKVTQFCAAFHYRLLVASARRRQNGNGHFLVLFLHPLFFFFDGEGSLVTLFDSSGGKAQGVPKSMSV